MKYNDFNTLLKENDFTINDLPLSSINENNENVIVELEKINDEIVWKTSVIQENNWIRVHRYYKDNSIEETYER